MIRRRSAVLASVSAFAIGTSRVSAAERTIGLIAPESRETMEPYVKAFRQGLADALAGRAVPALSERYVTTGGGPAYEKTVRELEQQGIALIVVQGAATVPVIRAKPSVPVVFAYSGDPIVAGAAQSLARPGGNATGMSFMSVELMPKRIDLLRTALPACRRIALLTNALHPGEEAEVEACRRAVEPYGVELSIQRVTAPDEIPAAVDRAAGEAQAVLMLPSATMVRAAGASAAQCLARKMPLVSGWASIARAGAMMTYGPNLDAAYRRVANYAVRVLDGARPADLPIERPTQLELVLNKRTAQSIDVTLPPTLLAQADDIID
jgi:putative ABC transport system substrate-binding protein